MNKRPQDIMVELHEKFRENFDAWKTLKDPSLKESFVKLHSISAIGEILGSKQSFTHHKICCSIFDELFSDAVSATYLATNSMYQPANILIRRVFELGLAAIYLWDLPHAAHAWKHHDQDLSFSEMIEHLTSSGYTTYVNSENGTQIEDPVIPKRECQRIYGRLSDIVHGKISTFVTVWPDRFTFSAEKWSAFIVNIDSVLRLLVNAFIRRYNIYEDVITKVPNAKEGGLDSVN